MNNSTFPALLVLDENNNVDVDATVLRFEEDLKNHMALQTSRDSEILAHAHAVFEQVKTESKGKNLAILKPVLIQQVLQRMNVGIANTASVQKQVADALLLNTGEKREDNKSFFVQKGQKGGGMYRWADVKETNAEKKEREQLEKATKA